MRGRGGTVAAAARNRPRRWRGLGGGGGQKTRQTRATACRRRPQRAHERPVGCVAFGWPKPPQSCRGGHERHHIGTRRGNLLEQRLQWRGGTGPSVLKLATQQRGGCRKRVGLRRERLCGTARAWPSARKNGVGRLWWRLSEWGRVGYIWKLGHSNGIQKRSGPGPRKRGA